MHPHDAGAPVPEQGHVSGRRGHSVFSSAVQYTQSATAIYAHFDSWLVVDTFTLKQGPWPAATAITATLLGLERTQLVVTVYASKEELTIRVTFNPSAST